MIRFLQNFVPIFVLALAAMPGARAAVITVNTLTDGAPTVDANCTLREAVLVANSDVDDYGCTASGTYGADTIGIPLAGTITLTGNDGEDFGFSGDLDIREPGSTAIGDVDIVNTSGGVVTIDGGFVDRVFDIGGFNQSMAVSLGGLVIQNGVVQVSPGGSFENFGGGVAVQGADVSLRLTDCIVRGNTVQGSGTGILAIYGGGVYTQGDLTLIRSEISSNQLINNANNGRAYGGGVYANITASGTLSITESRIADNAASAPVIVRGGGIHAANAVLTLARSEVSGNAITSTTNTALGGGVYVIQGGIELTNTTISGNQAMSQSTSNGQSATGGGGYISLGPSHGFQANNVTIADNRVSTPNGANALAGGLRVFGGTAIELANSILADNLANGSPSDCNFGGAISMGYNLVETNCGMVAAAGDQFGVDPMLASLADNGGINPVTANPKTQAPQAGSPVIDAGNPGPPTGFPNCSARDQRYFARPANGGTSSTCDIGAHEVNAMFVDIIFQDGFEGP